jgi:hypothetical protein
MENLGNERNNFDPIYKNMIDSAFQLKGEQS